MQDFCVEIKTEYSQLRLWRYSENAEVLRPKIDEFCRQFVIGKPKITITPRKELECH